ncbi:hypothetical protein BGZ68_010805 [Mortierella alpina]|nr:hypothetical protein BGZ68_010805 [Mortierella alpina]
MGIKFWTALAVAAVLAQSALAHMAIVYPMPRGGIETDEYDGKVHAFVNYDKDRTLNCNGYTKMGPVTRMTAGETINVRFWGPALGKKYDNKLPPIPKNRRNQLNQARHGGGFCQMSLSYDGGESFHLIGEYTHSCPDFYYEWPVTIPKNAPSCHEAGKCLFVWTWTAVNVPQFYINCADITIDGNPEGGKIQSSGIVIVDAPGYKKNQMAEGDGFGDKLSKGPIKQEKIDNEEGKKCTWDVTY